MNLNEVNKWWQRGIDKERARLTNAPKAPKSNRFATMTNFSTMAPDVPHAKKTHAR